MKDQNSAQNGSRRGFLKHSFLALAAVFVAPVLRKGSPKLFDDAMADGPLAPLSASDPLAMSLGYNPSASKVDLKKWPKKAGPDGKGQKCSSCMLYTAIDGKTGKCQIFQNKTVSASAWCNSWSKKA